MVKITKFESQKQPRQSFKAPILADATGSLLKTINKAANNHLDKQAKEVGIKEGEKAIAEGKDPNEIVKSPGTIYGDAFKESARVAYTNKSILNYRKQVDEAYLNNQDSIESFNKEARTIRDNISKSTPSEWQSDILTRYDNYAQGKNTAVAQNVVNNKIKLDAEVNDQFLEQGYLEIENLAELGGENSEAEILTIVDQMVATVKANYENPTQIYDAKDVVDWVQNTTFALVKGDILNDFEKAKTIGAKKELIEKLASGGWDTYYADAKELIEGKIKTVIPELEVPKMMKNQHLANVVSVLDSKYSLAENDLKDQQYMKKDKANAKINNGETLDEVEIQSMKDIGIDGEVVQDFENKSAVNEHTNMLLGEENYKKWNLDKIESDLELLEIQRDLYDEGASLEDDIKFLGTNEAILTLEKQKIKLVSELELTLNENTKMDIWKINDIEVADIMAIAMSLEGTEKHHSGAVYGSALDIAKEHKARLAKRYGAQYLDLIPLPFDTSVVKNNLQSKDVNKVLEGIKQVKAFEADMSISMLNELGIEADDPIFVALELEGFDNVLQQKILQSIVNEPAIDKTFPGIWAQANQDGTLTTAIMSHSDFKDKKTGYMDMGTTEMNRALNAFELVIKNEMVEHNKSFEEAFNVAKQLYDTGLQIVTFNKGGDEKILRIPNSVVLREDAVSDFQDFLNDFDENTLAWQVKCEAGLTLGQCEDSFRNNAEPRLEGSVGYLIQEVDKDYAKVGTDGPMILVGHGGQSNGELTTGLTFELDKNKRNKGFDESAAGHPYWKTEVTIPSGITVRKDGQNLYAHKKEYIQIGSQLIVQNGGVDDIAMAIAEGGQTQIFTGDTFGIGFGDKNENAIAIMGIVQRAMQQDGGFTNDEFKMLSQFADFDKLLTGTFKPGERAGAGAKKKEATELQNLVNAKWNEMKESGGYTGRFNGEKLSPTLTLYLIYKDALSEMED